MSFIGIICENKNENAIRQTLSTKIKSENIIFLNEENVENLKNITFKIVVIMINNKKIFSKKDVLVNIIKKTQYLIVNADEKVNLDFLKEINLKVVTYGFNNKSTVTTSSVEEEKVLLCIQRNIMDENNKVIEPQEIKIINNDRKITTSNLMGIATTLLISGY